MRQSTKNSSLEGQKHPYMRGSFWLEEYQLRINSQMYPDHVKERYIKLYNEIMKNTRNYSVIDPTLK